MTKICFPKEELKELLAEWTDIWLDDDGNIYCIVVGRNEMDGLDFSNTTKNVVLRGETLRECKSCKHREKYYSEFPCYECCHNEKTANPDYYEEDD